MSGSNITLIGMPGAGKSTVGVVVAKMLCKSFVDTDLLIQMHSGMKLCEIIDKYGNSAFLKTEGEVISALELENSVIATGGSVVLSEDAMKHLKEISRVIYLRASISALRSRLGDLHLRGVVLSEGQTLESLYEERRYLYEKYADVIIDSDDLSDIHTTAQRIASRSEGEDGL